MIRYRYFRSPSEFYFQCQNNSKLLPIHLLAATGINSDFPVSGLRSDRIGPPTKSPVSERPVTERPVTEHPVTKGPDYQTSCN